jgi:hypothetical protein
MTDIQKVLVQLHRANRELKRQRHMIVGLVVAILALGVYGYVRLNDRANEARDTHTALCIFRGDLQSRVDQTEAYLQEHPQGFPGVPKATLLQSLNGQKRTVTSLSILRCPPPSPSVP